MPDPTKPEGEPEDFVPQDDAAIGRAVRRSLVVLAVLFLSAGILYAIFKPKPKKLETKVTQITAPVTQQAPVAEPPTAPFKDISQVAGIRFKHFNGAYGEKLLPETMGGGAAFFDFDNDGDQDLLFVNGTEWPWHKGSGGPATAVLYQNDGKGGFTDVTKGSGLDTPFYGMGVACGDYDNDGLVDLLLTGVGGCHLFRNLGGGKFSDVTAAAGVGGDPSDWSTAATWVDTDNDGDLDLVVCNYVRWSKEIDLEVGYKLTGVGRAYGQPMNFQGAFARVYRNEGGGKFSDVSAASGVQIKNSSTGVPVGKTLGISPVDLDGDGWIDLVLANDTVQNFVFHNEKNGTFKEIGALSGIAFDNYGNTRGAMGIDAAHYRNDTALGVAIGNFANEMTALYVSQGAANQFADEAITEGIGPASRIPLKFGMFFLDYDLDGRLDLLSCNGHLEEEIGKIQNGQKYAQSAQLFWNCGNQAGGNFTLVPESKSGSDLVKPIVGRGSAYADIDGDGDLDVLLLQTGGAPLLLRNDQALGRHWVRLKLTGSKSNRDAIGAWVSLTSGGVTQRRQVMPTKSYLSQSELPLTFGLGSTAKIDEVKIQWPGGGTQIVTGLKADSVNTITQQ